MTLPSRNFEFKTSTPPNINFSTFESASQHSPTKCSKTFDMPISSINSEKTQIIPKDEIELLKAENNNDNYLITTTSTSNNFNSSTSQLVNNNIHAYEFYSFLNINFK